jgi:hypothetical protein
MTGRAAAPVILVTLGLFSKSFSLADHTICVSPKTNMPRGLSIFRLVICLDKFMMMRVKPRPLGNRSCAELDGVGLDHVVADTVWDTTRFYP